MRGTAHKLVFFALVGAMGSLMSGCTEDEDKIVEPVPELRLILIVSPDTLWFVTGETPNADVIVFASRGCCTPLAGVIVHTSLTADVHGWLEPADTQQGDTTDAYGQVRYHYFTTQAGTDIVRALCENAETSAQVVAAHPYNGETLNVSLFLVPLVVDLSLPGSDSMKVHVSAMVRDEFNLPVPGLDVHFAAQLGWLDPPVPTDSSGIAETWWHQPDAYPDTAWIEMTVEIDASIGIFNDAGLIIIRR